MHILFKKYEGACTDLAPLTLRVVLGIIFTYHGYQKVFSIGHEGVSGFMTSLGLPLPELMAFLVSYGELVGGILLILGLFTYWVTVVDIIIALVALFAVHLSHGFSVQQGGYEFILLILASAISLFFTGPGKYSLDTKLNERVSV
jgi:putative oxidoreductase